MKYKLVVFDFDGTLADTFPWCLGILDSVAEKYHLNKIDMADIENLRGLDAGSILKRYGVSKWKTAMIGKHVRSLMAKEIQSISLFDGVDNVLQELASRGATLGVVSSNSHENVTQVLGPKNAALIQHFECGVSIFGKSAKLKKVIKKSRIEPHESIYIGDEIRDIEAARNVNMNSGAVSWGYTLVEALKACLPGEVFTSFDDILTKVA